jgi:BolA protein
MLAMSVQDTIKAKLSEALQPSMLEVANESHMHGGPATESHFNITAVSATFTDLNLVRRHQSVYKLLQTELAGGVHALAMHLYTQQEWEQRQGSSSTSPDCRGGSKQDKLA